MPLQPLFLFFPLFLAVLASHTLQPHKFPTFPPAQVSALSGRMMAKPGRISQLQLALNNEVCVCEKGLRCCGSFCECDLECGGEVGEWECLL
ncbi:uncharacterized protein K444DRAFT_621320 [Hyaloscypha bicolor E]|uniref:Uncharacterized protein n=1 Tax=Hyaloscypha bicolor E TaxID=1095630 RepID=A0A2J6SN37_9HELO|nr:uncharacterized protein K444DRAFT_621320 [Hyaloscypha bicolor E]PMD52172.1 hypothetical protein K444DRAFT_621320 [Hyaloscypha bicolor E]